MLPSHFAEPTVGFHVEPASATAPVIEHPRLNETLSPINMRDMGLVPLATNVRFATDYFKEAEIEVVDGIPIHSPRQLEEEARFKLSAKLQGQSLYGKQESDPYVTLNKKSEEGVVGRYTGDFYTFPQKILEWSMGMGFSEHELHPAVSKSIVMLAAESKQTLLSQQFDEKNRTYNPNMDQLTSLGYGQEGMKRLLNLSLMTQFISYTNGVGRVSVDAPKCRMRIALDGVQQKLTSKEGLRITAIEISLHGLKAITLDNEAIDLTSIDQIARAQTPPDKAIGDVIGLCKDLITNDLNARSANIAGVQAALKTF